MLRDTVAIVAGGDTPMGAELAAGLVDAGATAVVTPSRFASPADAQQAFGPVAPFGLLVHVPFDAVALEIETLAATGEHEWEARGESVLRSALWSCQSAHACMVEHGGGRIVLVIPTVGLVGGAGRVPLSTAAEGMRTLAKVAARQWGGAGITVNCVGVAVDPVARGPLPAALGRSVDMRSDVAAVVALLAGEPARAITGATITVDGGVVML